MAVETSNSISISDLITDDAQIVWDSNRMRMTLTDADFIVAMGSSSLLPPLEAARLQRGGYSKAVICSGAPTHTLGLRVISLGHLRVATGPYENTPEYQICTDICEAAGVPTRYLYQEKEARHTGDNWRFSFKIAKELRAKGRLAANHDFPMRAIGVSLPFMEKRLWATALRQCPDLEVLVTSPRISLEEFLNRVDDANQAILSMVGNTRKLKYYALPYRDFQKPTEMMPRVWDACDRLEKLLS